jgi:hypothetical protein
MCINIITIKYCDNPCLGNPVVVLKTRYRTTVCADIVDYYWTTYDVLTHDVLTVSIL